MPPERIASLLASSTEILYGLGLGERVVGVSHECDFPTDACSKPRITSAAIAADASSRQIDTAVRDSMASGTALYHIDVELLATLRPQLIVTQSQCDVCAVRYEDVQHAVSSHAGLRGTQIVSLNPMTLEEVFADIRRVGTAAGVDEEAGQYVARLRDRVDAVREKTRGLSAADRPRVVCIEWIDPVMLAANWMPELIEWAGGDCPLTTAGEHSTYTEWSDIVRFDPQVVVIAACGFGLPRTLCEAPELRQLPGWQSLSAVREQRVFVVDGNAYFNRSGPRLVDSLEILAHLFHPRRFQAPLAADQQAQTLQPWS